VCREASSPLARTSRGHREHVSAGTDQSLRAILLVHGVGDARPGDDASLVAALETALGADAANFAVYELYYDFINDCLLVSRQFQLIPWVF
jgi:hypothetical protein